MNTLIKNLFLLSAGLFLISCSAAKDNRNTSVLIKTTLGDITVRLYDETPGHRDNFIKLVSTGFYEGVSFHRVIKEFMIQAGDPETKATVLKSATDTMGTYTIPAEFNPLLIHKKGALAAARQGNNMNPEMRSSGTQFYIVQGIKFSDDELIKAEERIGNDLKQNLFIKILKEISDSNMISGTNMTQSEIQEKATLRLFDIMETKGEFRFTDEQRSVYKNIGGTPRLDNAYTVFGEVVKGLDIVDQIAEVKTGEGDKPLTDIRILKMKLIRN